MALKLTEQPEEHERRSWTIPADYRNKNDAKVAVVHLAFEQSAIEFLRFKGESPPEGYKVELPPPRESKKAKRKVTDGTENEGEPPKKAKLLSQAEQFLALGRRQEYGPLLRPNGFFCLDLVMLTSSLSLVNYQQNLLRTNLGILPQTYLDGQRVNAHLTPLPNPLYLFITAVRTMSLG